MNFNNIVEHPRTLREAVDRLLAILTDGEKEQVKALTYGDLVLLHFTLGKDIRNADDAAMKIIEELWKRL